MAKLFLLSGVLNAGLCIVLGAFAAHKLKSMLSETSLATFQTGVQYHFYHSLALFLLALLMLYADLQQANIPQQGFRISGYMFIAGIILFSGSLYGLSLDAGKWLGPVTPIGGLCFIAAWFLLAFNVYKYI